MRKAQTRATWLFLFAAAIILAASARILASDSLQWKRIGPGGGGNMTAAAVSPADPNIAIMGSDVGGIFRTGDGGQTWSIRNNGLVDPQRFSSYGVNSNFGFDPVNTNVVYHGPMKSTDAGLTWSTKIDISNMTAAGGVVDPSNHNIVYVYAYANVFRSTDGYESTSCQGVPDGGNVCAPGGISCSSKTRCYQQSCLPAAGAGGTSAAGCGNYNDSITTVIIDPLDSTHLMACADSGIYETHNSAQTWTQILNPTGLPAGVCSGGSSPGAVCQSNSTCGGGVCQKPQCAAMVQHSASRTLFMAVKTHPLAEGIGQAAGAWVDIDSWAGGVYKSTDWGQSWTSVNGADGTNILPNSGFETAGGDGDHPAASWKQWPSTAPELTRDCTVSHSGSCSIKIAYNDPATGHGVVSDPITAVQSGQLYKISGWFKAQSTTGFTAYAKVYYFQDASGLQAVHWPGGPSTLAAVEPFYYAGDSTYDWRRFEAFIRPPDAAHYAQITFSVAYGSGTIYMDDVSFTPAHTLPKISGQGHNPYFVSYSDVVVDPTDVNTLYAGTLSGTALDVWPNNESSGLWKTSDGGANWTQLTRRFWHDNVQDNGMSEPTCGDNVCGGRWENCTTCPSDCTGSGKPSPPACCGNGTCETGENYDNCIADCPYDPDTNARPYYEADRFTDPATGYIYFAPNGGDYRVWAIGIGSGTVGHNTLYYGAELMKTTDGGATWSELSSKDYTGTDDPQNGHQQARGETGGVVTLDVVSDTRVTGRNWLFYGDTDNELQLSYNNGQSFSREGWQWGGYSTNDPGFVSPHVGGDAATSIVLDPTNTNRVYVGVADEGGNFQGADQTSPCCHGIVQGDFTPGTAPAVGRWTWTPLGDQSTIPGGPGGIELVRTPTGDFLAAIYARGIYKHVGAGTGGAWTCLGGTDGACPNTNWTSTPSGWKTYLIRQEPSSGRLYISAGSPLQTSQPPAGETGVWESSNNGVNWCRISDPGSDTTVGMDKEPVTDILLQGPNTMLVGTSMAGGVSSTDGSGNWTGDGGLYRGTRNGSCNWTWTKVIKQPIVTGATVSGADNSIVYGVAAQVCCSVGTPGQNAGVYKSLDGGLTWPSSPLANNGLGSLWLVHLYNHFTDFRKIYGSAVANGVFEGTVTCTDPVHDFECATRVNPSAQTVTTGSVTSGGLSDITAASPDDVYESLLEGTLSGKKRLNATWTFTGAAAGVTYRLRAEGLKVAGGGGAADDFNFSVATRTSGNCTGTESYGSTVITLNGTTDTDTTKEGNAGILPTGSTVFCVKVGDSLTSSDTQADTLSVDRLYLMPLQATVATADTSGGVGTRLSGDYVSTQAPDEQPVEAVETLKEGAFGNTSNLVWYWTFSVPLGSTHRLHFEGSRPNNPDGDDFKFQWATSTSGPWTDIPSATINSPTEITGGADSGTFGPANYSGTIYIYIRDTNSQANKTSLDTVSIDHLAVLTVP